MSTTQQRVPTEIIELAKLANKFPTAEQFELEIKRVCGKYNSATLRSAEAQRGFVVAGNTLTKKQDRLHYLYLRTLTYVWQYGGYAGLWSNRAALSKLEGK